MRTLIFILTIVSFTLSACKSTPYIQKKEYLLTTAHPIPVKSPLRSTIGVNNTVTSSLYQNNEFLYQLKGGKLTHDFYNAFATSPTQIITTATTTWMMQSNMFTNVLSLDLGLNSDYTLKSKLITLAANYSNANLPRADIQIEYILLNKKGAILLDKRYSAREPLLKKTTESLVEAWSGGFSTILNALSKDINDLTKEKKNFLVQSEQQPTALSDTINTDQKIETTLEAHSFKHETRQKFMRLEESL